MGGDGRSAFRKANPAEKIFLTIIACLAILANMDRRTRQMYEARARVVKALAHPARLFMVDKLAGSEFCVCELAEMVGSDISTVSRHLAQLREAGIVEDEKRGTQVFYRLAMPCVLRLFECVEPVLLARGQFYRELVQP